MGRGSRWDECGRLFEGNNYEWRLNEVESFSWLFLCLPRLIYFCMCVGAQYICQVDKCNAVINNCSVVEFIVCAFGCTFEDHCSTATFADKSWWWFGSAAAFNILYVQVHIYCLLLPLICWPAAAYHWEWSKREVRCNLKFSLPGLSWWTFRWLALQLSCLSYLYWHPCVNSILWRLLLVVVNTRREYKGRNFRRWKFGTLLLSTKGKIVLNL